MALLHTPAFNPAFTLPAFALPDVAGRVWSAEDCRGPKGLVLAFICNHCPYVQRVARDLAKSATELAKVGVGTAAIMSNDYENYPEDAPDKMAVFAAQHGFTFPYLIDADQALARACGAVCTPDLFGFDADNALVWRGKVEDMEGAMTQVATTGKAPADQPPSLGCSLTWKD